MLNWSEIIEGFQMPSVHEGYLCFELDDKEKEELKKYLAMCLYACKDEWELYVAINLNGYNKETLSKVFYYRTGKFIDEISEDELAEFGERKIISYEHISTNIPYRISDIIYWVYTYLDRNQIDKAVDEVKKIEKEIETDWQLYGKDEFWQDASKLYNKNLNLLCEGINKISNIPDEFKIAFNGIISSFNDKSQYKVPLLK